MSKDNGGAAFPNEGYARFPGMTMRDYFAAKFMSGVMASASDYQSYEDIAGDAYRMADAMLAERAKLSSSQ